MSQVVYISGQMSGLPDKGFSEFNRVAALLKEKGYEVINPVEFGEEHWTWEQYMRKDIAEMMRADIVAVLSNWTNSRGATLEVYIAKSVGIEVTEYWNLLK